jgi:cytochrome P450
MRLVKAVRRDQLGVYNRLVAEYGDVVRVVLGPPGLRRVLYLVTHPDGIEQVLGGDPGDYTKNTPYYREIAAYLGDGLLTSGGQLWRQQRRTVAPLFTHRRVAGYVDVMAEEAARVADAWADAAARDGVVDVGASMVDYALRAVGRILFGTDVDDVVPVIRTTFPVLNGHVRRRGLTPVRPPRWWPSPAEVRATRARRALYDVVDAIIGRRPAPAGPEEAAGTDLISLLLAARDPETGRGLTPQEIRDQVLIFLLAGHETTSTALTFTFQLLGRHPDAQADVRREVTDVLAGRSPRADDIGRLPLAAMALKEAMRLYPPAYALGRLAERDVTLGGRRVPAGSIVLLSPWATQRRPDLWPEPERFDPHRFAPEVEAERARYAYFPFAGGLRGCIGSHFAMTEAVVAVATLLSRYEVVAEASEIPLRTDITLQPATPVRCRVSLRPAPERS